jgi:hypothetical protein
MAKNRVAKAKRLAGKRKNVWLRPMQLKLRAGRGADPTGGAELDPGEKIACPGGGREYKEPVRPLQGCFARSRSTSAGLRWAIHRLGAAPSKGIRSHAAPSTQRDRFFSRHGQHRLALRTRSFAYAGGVPRQKNAPAVKPVDAFLAAKNAPLSGHANRAGQCPLPGAFRTWSGHRRMSAALPLNPVGSATRVSAAEAWLRSAAGDVRECPPIFTGLGSQFGGGAYPKRANRTLAHELERNFNYIRVRSFILTGAPAIVLVTHAFFG